MNIKEWIFPIILAIITTWFVQRFIVDKFLRPTSSAINHASGFIAPESDQPFKPLNTEVDFIDSEKKRPELVTEVITSWGLASFSSHGATLKSLDFDHRVDHTDEIIRTIYPRSDLERQSQCFLVALNQPTPYFYELVDNYDEIDRVILTYKAAFAQGFLIKIFTIHKAIHKIDLHCEVDYRENTQAVGLRIFYPSPFMANIAERDVTSALVIDDQGKFERVAWANLDLHRGWFFPAVFGADDTYFIHALCGDHNGFVQRAYYKFMDKNILVSILEGPEITTSSSWDLSFYCGPKTDAAVNAVDPRLDQTLGYAGFFAPISKLFLKILIFLFDYVGNYGLAIILLTLLLKIVMFPLTMRGDARMKQQQEMAKKIQHAKQRYHNDPEKLAQEQAALIKQYGMSGMGCLPMLLQIPVLIAMRSLLTNAIQLYHAPFLWIPDLSMRDPYYILPLLLVFSMFAQASSADKTQRMMVIAMGLILGAVMAQFAAGLVLYFVVYGFLTVFQAQFVRYFKLA